MLTSSYNGEVFQSKGNHAISIVSWFVTMRVVVRKVWHLKSTIATRVLSVLMSRIHPAAVKCPVSASLVGRSSHVKLSVRSIPRSILRCRNLRKRIQPVLWSSLNVGKYHKNKTKTLLSCCKIAYEQRNSYS